MHYIIDGHNLIGKMPDISLEDPDDEMRLVLRLKSWLAESKQRQVTLFFDGGVPGGHLNRLSSRNLQVIFAPSGQTADSLIMRHLKKLKNPGGYTLVTSDREIMRAAQALRIRFLQSEQFIERMGFVFAEPKKEKDEERPLPVPPEKPADPKLNDAEVQEWLDLFGPVPERPKSKPRPAKPAPPAEPQKPQKPARLRVVKDDEQDRLEADEVEAWLKLFRSGGKKSR
ncbi:MAG: NYN domain-containing protein [Chloroflexi bacterium]|nr:NYN domain-containing protein [Chloroflexota bacterium]MBK6712000.1 NYN domain-containing protein [Chloroflexota bacterium]MBK7178147.1 NYN domain-containing protein [Chloroflexota bacterium]